MPRPLLLSTVVLLLLLALGVTNGAAAQNKPALDHSAYAVWNQLHHSALSRDGSWVLARIGPEEGDDTLRVVRYDGTPLLDVPRGGAQAAFTADSRHVVSRIKPPQSLTGNGKGDAPPDSLAIVELASGNVTRIPGAGSFRMPEEVGGWVAFLHAKPDTTAADTTAAEAAQPAEERKDAGRTLTLRNLATGTEHTFTYATDAYRFSRDGRWLVYATATPDSTGDGVYAVATETGQASPVLTGPGSYTNLTLDEAGRHLAFLTNRADPDADKPDYALYHAELSRPAALVADTNTPGLPADWRVSEHGGVSFSKDGRRLFFGAARRPPADTTATLEGEPVRVDVWHWQDPRPQTVQLVERDRELRRSYQAVAHLDQGGRVVQLAREDMPDVSVGAKGNADVAIASTEWQHRREAAWDFPARRDIYLIDVNTGERRLIAEGVQTVAQLSPAARYAYWWDRDAATWRALSVDARRPAVDLGQSVSHPLYEETHDQPHLPGPYGLAGWTEGDAEAMFYDRYDVWAVDPARPEQARPITAGIGRQRGVRLRVVDLTPDEETINPSRPLMLSAFHEETKASGYYRVAVRGGAPEELVMMDRRFTSLRKAHDAERLLFQRESVGEFPDLWTSDPAFRQVHRVTDANPQQSQFRWATADRVTWTSLAGLPLEGILYKPEGFDSAEEHPLLVYFYDRHADGLHRHYAPAPHRSVIDPVFYASRGYVVFVPDIVYEEGYPGQSAYNSVMPGVTRLTERPYIDAERVGVQGHSWGGYQIAYLVTRTNLFTAAAAGAPVANMTSAYGGIRWETGRSRMFQYERTQSRIGGTLWEQPMRYLENSPLFEMDRVETPMLIMHNDRDGHVPFEQGVELFVALYRLGKPAWLINYNDEPHWPTKYHLKVDWQMRLQQFFDHYLMGAPAPRWLEEGIPATEKGRTLGFETAAAAIE